MGGEGERERGGTTGIHAGCVYGGEGEGGAPQGPTPVVSIGGGGGRGGTTRVHASNVYGGGGGRGGTTGTHAGCVYGGGGGRGGALSFVSCNAKFRSIACLRPCPQVTQVIN